MKLQRNEGLGTAILVASNSNMEKTSVSASDMFQTIIEMLKTAHLKMIGRWKQFGTGCEVTEDMDRM